MSPSTRKKVFIGGGVAGVLILALLIAPSFLDLNRYKPMLVSEVKKATGRDLVVEGPVSLSLLPLPSVSVTGVKFSNMPGSKSPNMVEIKSVTVKPSLPALLTGSLAVSSVTLVEPRVVLEVNAQGKPNWEFAPAVAEAKPAATTASPSKPVSLGLLNIENGTVLFSDSKAGLSVAAGKVNFTASVGSLDGPYSLAGSADVNGAPMKIDLSVGAKGGNGLPTDLSFESGGGKLTFKGALSELGPNARIAGKTSLQAESLTGFVASVMALAGQPAPVLPPLLAGKFSFEGGIDVSQTAIAAKDFKVSLAGDSGSGSLAMTLKPALAIEGKLTLPKIDLDHALAALATPASSKPAAPPPSRPAQAAAPASSESVLTAITAKVSIEAGEVIYNKMPIRNVALDLDAKGGAVAVPRLTATFPGDMVLQAKSTMSGDAAKPSVTGDFSLVGPKLRDTLKWLDVDTSAMPASRLQKASLKGRMASTGGNVQVTDAVFELDDIKGTGGVVVTFSVPLSVVAHVELDTLDVDPFLAGSKAAGTGGAKPAAPPPAAASGGQAVGGPTVGFKTKIGKLIYNKETISGIEVDVALQGSTLRINDVKVSNLGGGGRLAVRGTVGNYGTSDPHPDIVFNFEAPDMGRVLKLAGGSGPAGLGQVSASGGISGSAESVTLKELAINAMGYSLRANGVVAAPGVAKGAAQSVSYRGSVTLNGQTIEGLVETKLSGKPFVTADLKAGTLDIEKLTGGSAPAPAQAPAQRGRPPAAAAGNHAAEPIDTSAMRSVDASVKLVASTLVMAPLRINNADLAVALKDGVLTVSHFKGALFGGSLQLSGTADGSKPALSLDFKGDAENISLSEMLRQTSGSNQFGGAVKVTIDGKLNARNVSVRGAGATSEQIKGSMAGGADLSGHVFVGADKALTMLGSAATGAAGAAIDNTLGNVLGAAGQRGGVGAGNLLNAISLVLNRFVNHDSPISGRVDIAGGMLTDKSLLVSGNKSTANIATRTNLVASTTDTTINFMIAEDGSAPYLITTLRGPLSSPSPSVVRGTAKDPPGMANTLSVPGLGGGSQPGGAGPAGIVPKVPIPNIFGR